MDDIYYNELQNTLRAYDQKLWMIPSLFFVVVGFMMGNVDFRFVDVLRNGLILLIGSIFLVILILLYNKGNIFHILIQKKINEFDNKFNKLKNNNGEIKRNPLTSMTNDELDIIIHDLEGKYLKNKNNNEGAKFDCIQKFLAHERVSSWIRNIMLLIFIVSFLSSIYFFVLYFIK